MKAYLFWYIADENARITYMYVMATSEKQAQAFWLNYVKRVLGYVYDYTIYSCHEISEDHFRRHHSVGDILGEFAVL